MVDDHTFQVRFIEKTKLSYLTNFMMDDVHDDIDALKIQKDKKILLPKVRIKKTERTKARPHVK